jgi:hypothetical protein
MDVGGWRMEGREWRMENGGSLKKLFLIMYYFSEFF